MAVKLRYIINYVNGAACVLHSLCRCSTPARWAKSVRHAIV